MAQHDYAIDDQALAGATIRGDVNAVLAAIATNNSGTTEPAVKYPCQPFANTATGRLEIRNAANTGYHTIATLGGSNLGLVVVDVVMQFRATGLGIADDTAAIQAAIDFVESQGGGAVYFPSTSAFYRLTAALRVGSNTVLYGDGKTSRLKWDVLPPTEAAGDAPYMVRRAITNKNLALAGAQNTNISIHHLTIDLSLITGALAHSRQAVSFFNCKNTSVLWCHILCDGGAIVNVKTTNYVVGWNECEQVGSYFSSDGIIDQWWGSCNGVIAYNYIDGKSICNGAILVTASDTTGGAGGTMRNIKIKHNTIERARIHAIWVEGRIDTAQGLDISGNTIDGCGDGGATAVGYGIRVDTCDETTVSDNTISNCYLSAIAFSSPQGEAWTRNGADNSITDNKIKNAGLLRTSGQTGTYDAVEVYYNNNLKITGNNIKPLSSAPYEYAITVDATAADAIVTHNVVRPGSQPNAINFGAQATKIMNNVGFKTEAAGAATIASGASSFTVTNVGLSFDPSATGSPASIAITPTGSPSNMASLGTPVVTGWTATQFTVQLAAATSQALPFRWAITRL